MKPGNYIAIAACLLSAGIMTGADAPYDRAQKALSSKDYPNAIAAFEEALLGEPDSLRNGSEYRMAILKQAKALHPKEGKPDDYEREIQFFTKLQAANPKSVSANLNYGFTYVDKIPAAGSITQVILANTALTYFTKSIEIKPTWIGLYTRGNSYLFWPKIFGKTGLGLADLQAAYAIQKTEPKRSYHVRVHISLGDAYWKSDNLEKAREIWKEGLAAFPDSQPLKDRLSKEGDTLQTYIESILDPNKRVDTDLKEVWMAQQQ